MGRCSVSHGLASKVGGDPTMKMTLVLFLIAALGMLTVPANCQDAMQPDSLGLPGDNLNLYAVLKAFQESPTLEEFERRINSKEERINNLDLDGDGNVDYIRVKDNAVGDEHTIVLEVQLSKTDSQDVAIIAVNKDQDDKVFVQIVGDEALYGKDYIIEPNYDRSSEQSAGETPNPAYNGQGGDDTRSFEGGPVTVERVTPVEVYRWPIVQYIYVGGYRPWWSPWYFGSYPAWWRPWRPSFWHAYWGYHYYQYRYYFGHYRRWQSYRYPLAHARYFGTLRATSRVLADRRRGGMFRDTYTHPELRKEGVARYRAERRREMRDSRIGIHAQKETLRRNKRDAKPSGIGRAPNKTGGSGTFHKNRDGVSSRPKSGGAGKEAKRPALQSPHTRGKGERGK
jgi:hypothetical protein